MAGITIFLKTNLRGVAVDRTIVLNKNAPRALPFKKYLNKVGHVITYRPLRHLTKLAKAPTFPDQAAAIILDTNEEAEEILSVLRSAAWYADVPTVMIGTGLPLLVHDPNIMVVPFRGKELYESLLRALILNELGLRERLGVQRIVRSIEFPPEYYQSGITILSYFATILRQRDLAENVKVAIEQNGLSVTLVIESPTGQREAIEQTLKTYALVATGKVQIDALINDPYQVLDLRNQLRLAYSQLESKRELLALATSEVSNLRADLSETHKALAIVQNQRSVEVQRFTSMIEELMTQNTEMACGLQRLAEHAMSINKIAVVESFNGLKAIVERGLLEGDRDEFIQRVEVIRTEAPSLFDHVSEFLLKSAASGTVGNFVYDWLRIIIGSLPK